MILSYLVAITMIIYSCWASFKFINQSQCQLGYYQHGFKQITQSRTQNKTTIPKKICSRWVILKKKPQKQLSYYGKSKIVMKLKDTFDEY